MIVTAGKLLLVEFDQYALAHRFVREEFLLRFRAVAPEDLVRFAQLAHLFDPGDHVGVLRIAAPQFHIRFISAIEAARKQGTIAVRTFAEVANCNSSQYRANPIRGK